MDKFDKPSSASIPLRIKILALLAAALGLTAGGLLLTMKAESESVAMAPYAVSAPFVLTDQDGRRFDSVSLRGRAALVFFGFTHCPDVCPTTLAAMTNVLDALGGAAAQVQPVFISVDPARDTPAVLKAFGALFDTRILMLTGTTAEIEAVAKSWFVYYKLQPPDASGNYAVDHTATVFLIDRDGRFRSTFDFHEDEKIILEKVKLLIGG